ncbi:MAG: 2-amino-4-hydroxy-6-hydroxymethyldihydropteridine diphosphokinase [Vibrio sp.]|uniref:2-amino-4-hydroxy-6- hydroxymethyldihydropteridine diphosphokinase n=1 Tax=Vibrio sp. TaxID=678 RepID=UPI003A88C9FE
MITAYAGVGSNIERRRHIEAAIQELSLIGSELRLSTIYECPAQGFDSHPFFNLVVELKTSRSLDDFQRCLKEVEFRWGRAANTKKYQDRTLDMDIILFGDVISLSSPVVPRPDIYQYPFVIQPLYELCPERQIPGTDQSIKKVWQNAALLEQLKPVPLWFSVK